MSRVQLGQNSKKCPWLISTMELNILFCNTKSPKFSCFFPGFTLELFSTKRFQGSMIWLVEPVEPGPNFTPSIGETWLDGLSWLKTASRSKWMGYDFRWMNHSEVEFSEYFHHGIIHSFHRPNKDSHIFFIVILWLIHHDTCFYLHFSSRYWWSLVGHFNTW